MWASRFYGMDVPPDVELHEELTDRSVSDLVDAHLGINYSYFGAIDKTLSGFVVLDDEDDNYTLFDCRDTGQVFWQDHETRDLALRNDSLAGYLAKAESRGPRETRRAVSTPDLCARYQWLVWALARPLMQDGVATQTTDYLIRNALGRFRALWSSREVLDRAFAREAGTLAYDPHLAIYWLLHATTVCDDDLRARVVAAIGEPGTELARMFVERFHALPATGDIAVVPGFRERRALILAYGSFELSPEEVPSACLRALEVSPQTNSLLHAFQIAGALDRLDATPVLARIADTSPGVATLRALLEKRGGATSSRHADTLARLLIDSSEPWFFALECLWLVHELAYDGMALVAATRRLIARDRYHRRALQMAHRAAQIAGQPIAELERDLAIADALSAPFAKVAERPHDWQTIIGALAMPLRHPFAWRVLQRVEVNKPPPGLALWAARQVIRGGEPLIGSAFALLDDRAIAAIIEEIGPDPGPDDISILLAYLDGPEPGKHDVVAKLTLERGKQAALTAIASHVPEAAVFAKLMTILERPAAGGLANLLWGRLFSLHASDTYVVPRLDDKQAIRVARALIAHNLRHPDPTARAAAGHALFRFSHPASEPFLVDALTDYGVRYAAARGGGDDQLDDLVGNLYAAVRSLATPTSRSALAERVFAERRAYWRMARALAEIWDPALHTQILSMLRDRRDARAAGAYAYALRDFVKQREPLADLLDVIADWQGDTDVARGFLHYALVVGIDAALSAGRNDLVRRAHEATAWIAEPPLEPDHHARGTGWANPLEDPEVAAALQRVLHPEEPGVTAKAAKSAEAAKRTPKAKAKATTTPKAKATPTAQATATAQSTTNAQATPTAKPASKARSEAAPKAKPKAAPKPQPKAAAKTKSKIAPKAKPKAAPKAKPKAAPKTKTTAAPKAKAKPLAKSKKRSR